MKLSLEVVRVFLNHLIETIKALLKSKRKSFLFALRVGSIFAGRHLKWLFCSDGLLTGFTL